MLRHYIVLTCIMEHREVVNGKLLLNFRAFQSPSYRYGADVCGVQLIQKMYTVLLILQKPFLVVYVIILYYGKNSAYLKSQLKSLAVT